MTETSLPALLGAHAAVVARLYDQSGAARWNVTPDTLAEALLQSVRHSLPERAGVKDVRSHLESLHVADLALACALRAGHGAAWDHFVLTYRPDLYAAARTIAGDQYRELADSLYGALFGVSEKGTARRSLFDWYHGRSRLMTWLRSILVQRHIDARRATARLEPLEAPDDVPPASATAPEVADPDRLQWVAFAQEALDAAVGRLDTPARLRLRLYYGESLTLAQIGRITGEHEATISRKLDRARRQLRREVEDYLRREHRLSSDAIARCFQCAADAPELQLTRLLGGLTIDE
jgi:RNA polymerase sigma factor (sigma-70 family)